MIRLQVLITLPSGEQLTAGELVSFPERQPAAGAFRYVPGYLRHPDAFALDPHLLPLREGEFDAGPMGLHGVFEDSLPDDWGRGILVRHHRIARARQSPAHLLAYLGDSAFGALGYQPREGEGEPVVLDGASGLADLLAASQRYEREEDPEGLEVLFRAGSGSAGGARPKAPITHQGASWLAKLPSQNDKRAVVRVEAACMRLAEQAGLLTAETQLHHVGEFPVLLVKRFDVSGSGRRHMVTLKTLLQAGGYYHVSYAQVADAVRRVSARPSEDLRRLYRWMVFNVLVGNTDDHLKNFTMLHDEQGWRLSPAYDLVADVAGNHEHVLAFRATNYPPGRKVLANLTREFGLPLRLGQEIIEEVRAVVSGWRTAFEQADVPAADMEVIGRSIERRLSAA